MHSGVIDIQPTLLRSIQESFQAESDLSQASLGFDLRQGLDNHLFFHFRPRILPVH